MSKPKVLHITNIASLYRKRQWQLLLEHQNLDYHFYYGDNPYLGIKAIDTSTAPFTKYSEKLHIIKNLWVKKKYLIWQSNVILKCLTTKANLVILLGEFNVISNWIATIICRIRKINVAHRGHGLYGNEKGLKRFLRLNYYRLASTQLVYERRGKRIFIENGFEPEKIHIIFNSLDYDEQKKARIRLANYTKQKNYSFFSNPDLPTLIFVGRLTEIKKLHLLLEAKNKLDKQNFETNLLLVGDGTERTALEKFAKENLIEGTYHFYGASYDDEVNEKLISCADICISPGNVGLTAIHSLSYGTPVITHGNFYNQMPEVEAITENKTGLFFEENNSENLALKIKQWLTSENRDREDLRQECFEVIDQYYNPYYQVKVLENLALNKPALL